MKVPWPDAFEDGDMQTFLQDFEEVAEPARKLKALRARVLHAVRRGPEKMKWAAAKDALIVGFDTPADRQRALRSFRTVQLGVHVNPLSHAAALHTLLSRGLPMLDDVALSNLLLDCFMESVPEE
ncbi:unnamed protein product [Echinostoma caproni]|uniref:SEC7 domain-containing protein n=1 Tax=Echinostoma caproni TaxID=27848 RepID=A0A183B096_9TREM|nr:unnamed protein product [Echinostoma caproni]